MSESTARWMLAAGSLLTGLVLGAVGTRFVVSAPTGQPGSALEKEFLPSSTARTHDVRGDSDGERSRAAGHEPAMRIPDGGPDAWLEAWQPLTRPRERERFLIGVVETYGRSRSPEVISFLRGLSASPLRNAALRHALELLAETKPEAALDQIPELLQGMDAQNAAHELLDRWGGSQPREALGWVLKQSDPARTTTGVEQVFAAAARIDPAQTRQLLSETTALTAETRLIAQRALAGVWAQSEPEAALAWVHSLGAAADGTDLRSVVYLNWAGLDPAASAASVAQDDAALLPAIADDLAGSWAQSDPAAAAAWLGSLPGIATQGEASGTIAQAWSQADPAAALTWARSLPADSPARREALRGVLLTWTRFDATAFQKHVQSLPPAAQQEIHSLLAP